MLPFLQSSAADVADVTALRALVEVVVILHLELMDLGKDGRWAELIATLSAGGVAAVSLLLEIFSATVRAVESGADQEAKIGVIRLQRYEPGLDEGLSAALLPVTLACLKAPDQESRSITADHKRRMRLLSLALGWRRTST